MPGGIIEILEAKGWRIKLTTTTAGGRLIFHVMGALAEFERALISERTRAGMAAARSRGHHMWISLKLTPEQIAQAQRARSSGCETVDAVAARLGVSPSTLHRAMRPP